MAAEYTYGSISVLAKGARVPAAGAVGQLTDLTGIPANTYDLSGNLSQLRADAFGQVVTDAPGVGFKADIPQGILSFGDIKVTVRSLEVPFTQEEAKRVADQTAATFTGTFATQAQLSEVATGDPIAVSDATVAGALEAEGSASRAAVLARVNERVAVRFGASGASAQNPNVILGGELNGSGFASDVYGSVILNPGQSGGGFNNVVGGDGSATVGVSKGVPNVTTLGTDADISVVGGYDNVAGSLSSKIISDHSYTAVGGPGHNAIFGGANHVAKSTAGFSMIAGGDGNKVGGTHAFATGLTNTVDGNGGAAFGTSNTVSAGQCGFVAGQNNTVSKSWAWAMGLRNVADGIYGSARGHFAHSRNAHQHAISSGSLATTGDAQTSTIHFSGKTTTATAAKLTPGANTDFAMVRGQSVVAEAMVVAREVGGATLGAWKCRVVCEWGASGASANLGTPTSEVLYSADPGLTAKVDGLSSVGTIRVVVTGLAGRTIAWSARMDTVELIA